MAADQGVTGTESNRVHFIVYGEDVVIEVSADMSVAEARNRALGATRTARPAEEWEIRDERGLVVEPELLVAMLPVDALPRGSSPRIPLLFLSPKIGAGG